MSGLTGFMCPNLSSPTISDVHKINQRKLFCQFSNQLCDQNKKGTIDRPFICCATELIFKHTFLAYGINIFISFCMPCSGLDVVSSYWYMYSMIIMSVSDEGYYRNVSDEGYYRNVSDEGYSRNVSDEGYSRNVSDEDHYRNVSDEGYSRNAETTHAH